MKLLVVDDETQIRKAIIMLLPKGKLGIDIILEADCPATALEVIRREKPEVMLSDVAMPGMNGIELLEQARTISPDMSVVMISGYNNFEYLRGAMQYGSLDYLLKPIDREQLSSAIKNAIERWYQQNDKRQTEQQQRDQIDSFCKQYQWDLLSAMLHSESPKLPDWCDEKISALTNQTSILVLCCTEHLQHCKENPAFPAPEAILQQLSNTLDDKDGVFFIHQRSPDDYIALLPAHKAASIPRVIHLYGQHLKIYLPMGHSSAFHFPSEITAAFVQAKSDLLQATMNREAIYPETDTPHRMVTTAQIQALDEVLISGSQESGLAFIAMWADGLDMNCRLTMGTLLRDIKLFDQLCFARLQMIARKRLTDCSFDAISGMPFGLDGYFQAQLYQDLLYKKLFHIIQQRGRALSKDLSEIQKIANYMDTHYSDDFKQSEYAQRFFMNKEYMCRKFKEDFGVGMVEYLNRVRVSHAKALLADETILVAEVAVAVGYRDEKYFSRIFKKMEQISPREYRKKCLDYNQ